MWAVQQSIYECVYTAENVLMYNVILQIGISESGSVGTHGWLPYDKSISNYFTFDKDPSLASTR